MATFLVNGTEYSWGGIVLELFGVPVQGITAISYKKKQAKTNNYGAGTKPVSRGYGKEECDGSIEVLRSEWTKVIAVSPSQNPLAIGWFPISVTYGTSMADVTIDILQGVEFLEDPFDAKEGDTKLLVKLPLIIADIEH
jgi:hypothetical protein